MRVARVLPLALIVSAACGTPPVPAAAPLPTTASALAPLGTAPLARPSASMPVATAGPAAAPDPVVAAAPTPDPIRWIAVGGGSGPEDNQVQIESDLALAVRYLGPGGVVLYAGGPGTRAVQVEDEQSTARAAEGAARVDQLLAELLDPRAGRAARYRATTLAVHDEATFERVAAWLGGPSASPLTLVLAGHGSAGATPAVNEMLLWGGDGVRPGELAPLLAKPARVVMTSCYSGAFADLVFADADPTHGAASPLRCGFFATSPVRVASGCDPDPERQHTEGYALHFFPALAGLDRDGRALAPAEVDFDGDGRVSFAEAHARARIASRGFDVPTSTSARWLEVRAPASGAEAELALPEEDAVVRALVERLGVADAAAAERRLATLDAARTEAASAAERAQDDEDGLARAAIGELLARWPELGDPWHPAFRATLERARTDVAIWLRESPRYAAYRDASESAAAAAERADEAALAEAPFERLVQAAAYRLRARRLKARGGADEAVFEAVLACERGLPQKAQP